MYVNREIQGLAGAEDYQDRRSCLCLDMNENPEGLPEAFVREVLEKMDGKLMAAYPHSAPLVEGIAEREGVRGSNICLTGGFHQALMAVFQAFTHPGSRVVATAPCSELCHRYSRMFQTILETEPCETAFCLPFQKLKDRITEGADLLLLSNPDSSAGGIWSLGQIAELLDICTRTGTLMVMDEACYPFGAAGAVGLTKANPLLLVLRSFSGLYSMAGLRAGYGVGDQALISCLDKALPPFHVNAAAILFGEELLRRPEIAEGLIRREEEGRNYLLRQLREAGYEAWARGGNYIFIMTRRRPLYTAARLRDRHILVRSYEEGPLKDWIRVTTAGRPFMERFWREFLRCDG